MRDKELDIYRGLIMIYIVGIVHTVYWTGMFSEFEVRSLVLFEMSVIFFITGASYTLSRKTNYFTYIKNRVVRVVIPYLVFGAFVVGLNLIIKGQYYSTDNIGSFIMSWVNPFSKHTSQIRFTTDHLWFIPSYIISMFFIPILYKVYDKCKNNILKVCPIVIFIVIIYMLDRYGMYNHREWYFYLVWIYIGFFYRDKENYNVKPLNATFIGIGILFLMCILIKTTRYGADMQANKFPPNFIFLIYTLGTFAILYSIKKYILILGKFKYMKKLVEVYSNRGYTCYLYHALIYSVIYTILGGYPTNIPLIIRVIIAIVNIMIVVITTAYISKLFYVFEDIKLSKKPVEIGKSA